MKINRSGGHWLTKPFLVAFIALLGLSGAPSFAGGLKHIQVDFGYNSATDVSNDANGEAWTSTGTCVPLDGDGSSANGCVLDFSTATATANSSSAVSLPFSVNLNGTSYTQVHVNQNGILTFKAALGAYTAVSDLASLQAAVGAGNPFIAAFYPSQTPLGIPVAGSPSDLGFNGGAEYGRGLANPSGTEAAPFSGDSAGDVPAFKATWVECLPTSNNPPCPTVPANPVQVRIVLYDRSDVAAGDFDLRFEYNNQYDTVGDTAQYGVVGFSLGSAANTVNLSGSAAAPATVGVDTVDIYYQFRNGVLAGTTVAVPDVAGKSSGDAATAITAAGLVVGGTTLQSSATVASGLVIKTDPAAGISVATGSAVNLFVSSGPVVPNVVGLTQAAATTAIVGAGLKLGTVTTAASSTVAAGSVISTNPGAGVSVAINSLVNLVVSSGQAKVTVPNVVNQTLTAAKSAITSVGLNVGTITNQASSSVPANSVISQNPSASASVAAGTAVNLVVSTGLLRGDVNGDGQVDIRDLLLILESFGRKVGAGDPRDLNGDHVVNLRDASILIGLCTNTACAIRSHR